jgi:NTE family protein
MAPRTASSNFGIWAEATQHTSLSFTEMLKLGRSITACTSSMLSCGVGPSIYQHRLPGLWSALPWIPNDVALFDHAPLRRTLEKLVDFGRLNGGETRLTIGCVDIETGDEVYFDTQATAIRPEHIMASAAILPAFPPVEVDGTAAV